MARKHGPVIWIIGVALCFFFLWALLPMGGPPGHQWVMPLGALGTLFFGGGCVAILAITFLADWLWGRRRKKRDGAGQ
jgi:hypothetical protein